MKNKIIILMGILLIFLAGNSFSQVTGFHSRWELGNLFFYDADNMNSLLDAQGPDVVKYINHFVTFDTTNLGDKATLKHFYALNDWMIKRTSTTASVDTPGVFPVDSASGMIFIGGAQGQGEGVQMQLYPKSFYLDSLQLATTVINGNMTYFGARVQISDDSLLNFFIGLADTSDSIISGFNDTLGNGNVSSPKGVGNPNNPSCGEPNYIGFRVRRDSCFLEAVTRNEQNETSTIIRYAERYDEQKGTSDTTFSDSTFYKMEFFYDAQALGRNGDSGAVYFYVNDILEATHTTNIPDAISLTPTIAVNNAGSAGQNDRTANWSGAYVDWIRAIMIRVWDAKQGN